MSTAAVGDESLLTGTTSYRLLMAYLLVGPVPAHIVIATFSFKN